MRKYNYFKGQHLVISGLVYLVLVSCFDKKKQEHVPEEESTNRELLNSLQSEDFETTINGKSVGLYTIKNKNGLEATFTNYGQRLVTLYVPDKNGEYKDVVLGFNNLDDFRNANEKYFGATIGRYGNRIAKGIFTLDGEEYTLVTNNGENHLHGGTVGFESVVWDVDFHSDNQIQFSRTSPDGEEGYPGNLTVKVNYIFTNDNELQITYEAKTDKKTVVNLTHHSFFNLRGEGNGTINDHFLMINADKFTPVDEGLIPTGELRKVEGTPFDFKQPKAIGKDLEMTNEQLVFGKGYDHNFVLNDTHRDENGLVLAAEVFEPESGRVMKVFTDEPGIQFYGGNFLNGTAIGKSGKPYVFRGSFCLETQHFPDSPNHKDFPSTVLEPGETYTSTCVYKFGIK